MLTMQRNPNGWSCLPAAFAMVIDKPLRDVLTRIGHDGSEILWKENKDPMNRRSFHIQEIIRVAYGLGYTLCPFDYMMASAPTITSHVNIIDNRNFVDSISNLPGLIMGRNPSGLRHVMAWDGTQAYDPGSGSIGPIADQFEAQMYWQITRRMACSCMDVKSKEPQFLTPSEGSKTYPGLSTQTG